MSSLLASIINTSKNNLNNIDMNIVDTMDLCHDTYYYKGEAGREHYRLLSHVSNVLPENSTIFDIGTNRCMSAIALSHNPKVKVISYDVINLIPNPSIPNIEFIIGDVLTDDRLNTADVIFLDTNHDGIFENQLREHLIKIDWKGILILDDIHLNDPMKEFWNSFGNLKKIDITYLGHWSGTGVVLFE